MENISIISEKYNNKHECNGPLRFPSPNLHKLFKKLWLLQSTIY